MGKMGLNIHFQCRRFRNVGGRNGDKRGLTHFAIVNICLALLLLDSVYGEEVRLKIIAEDSMTLGQQYTLSCIANETSSGLWWTKGKSLNMTRGVEETEDGFLIGTLTFANLSLSDFSQYTCNTLLKTGEVLNVSHSLYFEVQLSMTLTPNLTVKNGDEAKFTCNVTGYPVDTEIHWIFAETGSRLTNSSEYLILWNNASLIESSSHLIIRNASHHNDGIFKCKTSSLNLMKEVSLTVKSKPIITFDIIKPVGTSRIFVNWTLNDGNAAITELTLTIKEDGKGERVIKTLNPKTDSAYYLIDDLKRETSYSDFSIKATNEVGSGEDGLEASVRTLAYNPSFVPTVSLNGLTSNTVTLRWDIPLNASEYFHFYNVSVGTMGSSDKMYFKASENPFMVNDLRPGTDYLFQVQACSSFTKRCDEQSNAINGTTLDGMSTEPRNVRVSCKLDQKTGESSVVAFWDIPENPNGKIIEYIATLSGNASFFDERGRPAEEEIPLVRKTLLIGQPRKILFSRQPPNTNIYVSVCAKTRSRMCGTASSSTCMTPSTVPSPTHLSKANWKAVERRESKKIYFLVTIPWLSQRNGSICCIRVIVVRLPNTKTVSDLGPPHKMEISTYDVVHNRSSGGAYIADILDPSSRNTMIGDDIVNGQDKRFLCHRCWALHDSAADMSLRPTAQYSLQDISRELNRHHRKRHTNINAQTLQNLPGFKPHDGPLDMESTYTAYLDAIVLNGKHEHMRAQSRYFHPLRPVRANDLSEMIPALPVLISLMLALVVGLITLMCVMRWRRKEPAEQDYEMDNCMQQWCRRLRGQQPILSDEPPNMPPIPNEMLINAYIERTNDNGFHAEFEKLPDRFCDRTSHASDLRENVGKNRYPDIKAYDQTRVKLLTSEDSSDYINANYVVGYKERKKFICAQGPMDATMIDWWKMIWEQRVHLILMLTNIEEYNKTKCAKYWPSEESLNYGDLTITHMSEKRYSDYLVRTLKLSKSKGSSGDDNDKEEREITQYHYLIWKDFMAPEYPVGIIRFIKRFNEVYTPDKGPALVHCSAGVGRTGTLVALDSLLQQLKEEGCVSIFNTICDLRHQRNYLVQSLKQYTFIYRALMEASQFGDTEISVSELKCQIDKLKEVPEDKEESKMQSEYNRLAQVIEDRKPMSVGALEENRQRNRHETIVPYDRNRVILTPMPGFSKDMSSYINASFIEGYENTEQFIIAQDPLETTVGDFWRMIVQQNVRSIVMLSETGENKCPRYWPEKDQETTHEYIKVKYMQSQSFPFYYRREFTVTDTISDNSYLVTQFQYNGWPVGEGEVPQVDRGVVELIDTTFKYRDTIPGNVGPTLAHCSDGADRSGIFVAISILAQQMMNESRVDVFSVIRKLRSQRQGMFRNFAQYEFIYRGLVTYAELHVANGNASH